MIHSTYDRIVSRMTARSAFWYRRFRAAAYVSAAGLTVLTLLIVLPFHPFSYLPPIIEGGGPGTWFLLGYILYAAVGFGGFAGLSALMFAVETYEGRRANDTVMAAGFILLFAGVTVTSILLLLAGALGGYAINIEGNTTQFAQGILSPYVDPITLSSLVSVIAAGLLVFGMTSSKMPTIE